jgi:hypothetical protein
MRMLKIPAGGEKPACVQSEVSRFRIYRIGCRKTTKNFFQAVRIANHYIPTFPKNFLLLLSLGVIILTHSWS